MQSTAQNPENYIHQLPEDRQAAMAALRRTLLENLPTGFEEIMSYGMISYVVPKSLYPVGYHCNPDQPLPFISIASQKNFIALYHMGLYASPDMLNWFTAAYPNHSKTKLDMGKSCIRFKTPDQMPLDLIAALAAKIKPRDWIMLYESSLKK